MIEYNNFPIEKLEDYQNVYNHLEDSFKINSSTAVFFDKIRDKFGLKCKNVLVEFPYYDSDFLSSYYLFYIKKFKDIGKKSYRIHLFGENQSYLGYFTIRPNVNYSNISKSYISPKLLVSSPAYLLLSDYKVHIYGDIKTVQAFPWMNQQKDFSNCAHVATWSVLKYYGNEHTGYRDLNMGELTEQISEYVNRKFPSKGLTLQQISEALKAYQLSPILLKPEKDAKNKFIRSIYAYVESGCPVIAVINSQEHAFVIMGHGPVHYERIPDLTGLTYSSELIDLFYVSDDTKLPYKAIDTSVEASCDSCEYLIKNIDYILIPLYNRVHLEYEMVSVLVDEYLKNSIENGSLSISNNSIVRIYLTSSNSLKNKTAKDLSVHETLRDIITRLEMPKMVWCADISTYDEYPNELMSARIVIDSTSSNGDLRPWLLIHDSHQIEYLDNDKWKRIPLEIKPYKIFKNNLQGVNLC